MELPEDVLNLIKEYSMPMTHPRWRNLHVMSNQRYYLELIKLKDRWWERDRMIFRRMGLLPFDKLMRRYILRYQIYLMADFEWDARNRIS